MQAFRLHRGRCLIATGEAVEIKAGGVLHQFMHGGATPGRSQINLGALIGEGGGAADLLTHRAHHLLSELHHPDVVAVGLVDLHRGEFGVVAGADALVTENAPQLVDALKSANHQTLEVQLGGDPQRQRQIQRVVMSLEGTGIGTTRLALEHRSLDLQKRTVIQPAANCTHRVRPAPEGLPRLGRHDQVEVTLAIALLHIRQAMPLVRQGLQRLGEHRPLAHLHRQFAAVGAAQDALDPD